MQVRSLTVGPIIGAVTPSSVRLFGRGDRQPDRGWLSWWNTWRERWYPTSPRWCTGVARLRRRGDLSYGAPVYFPMKPHFDWTGIAVFANLEAVTEYEYQIGWFYATDRDRQRVILDWSQAETYQFRTASRDRSQMRSFIFGSCRYLLKLFSGSIWDDRGDKTFRAIADQLDAGIETDALLMLGDQIYADDLNAFDPDTKLSQFFARYRDHFTQPHQRSLMARVPTYMTLDDHEIEDNWPHKANDGDRVTLYPVALHSYLTYQASHSPLFDLTPEGTRITGTPTKLWYSFRDGCCDFFITDTRTERQVDHPDQLELLSPRQMEAIKAWLEDGAEAVKFIGSAVPFFPDGVDPSDDKWSGFIDQRDELLEWIRDRQIRRVVFLSGDVHCSLSASLSCDHDREFQIISLISSAFFWPYPDRKYTEFQMEGAIVSHAPTPYQVKVHTSIVREDNFTRVTASLLGITVETFSRKGRPLTHTTLSFA